MSDWNGWPEEELDFGSDDTDAPSGYGAEDGYRQEGFGPADNELPEDELSASEGFGQADVDASTPGGGPIGYGVDPHVDEPLDAPAADSQPGAGSETAAGGAPAGPQVGFGPAEAPVGADPDLAPYGEGGFWPEPGFPDVLDLGDLPEPVDGFPWTDPATLGGIGAELPDLAATYTGAPDPAELAGYAGDDLPAGEDAWSVLAASPDPATSSLARWWSPNPPW